jgi:hypothetical protein
MSIVPFGATPVTAALEKALELAAQGLPCFPCNADKSPRCPHWKPGEGATADPDALRALWRSFPGTRIGIPMGEASGLFCLDIDDIKHPEAGEWLELNRHRFPKTRVHTSESGGLHFLFAWRPGLGSSNGKLHRGVDHKGTGGYIIWWPAHVEQSEHLLLPLSEVAPVPQWLELLINPPAPPRWARPIELAPARSVDTGDKLKRLEAILTKVAGARTGERNSLLFWGACRISEMVLEAELRGGEIAEAISTLFQIGERLGLSRREVQRTIESAIP